MNVATVPASPLRPGVAAPSDPGFALAFDAVMADLTCTVPNPGTAAATSATSGDPLPAPQHLIAADAVPPTETPPAGPVSPQAIITTVAAMIATIPDTHAASGRAGIGDCPSKAADAAADNAAKPQAPLAAPPAAILSPVPVLSPASVPVPAALEEASEVPAVTQEHKRTSPCSVSPSGAGSFAPQVAAIAMPTPGFAIAAPATLGVDRHLDLMRGDAWLSDLARDIASTATDKGRLSFVLAPATLGRLDVDLQQGSGGLNVHMTAHNQPAREILAGAQQRIADEIRAQGVPVAGTQVSSGGSAPGDGRGGRSPRPASLLFAAATPPDSAAPPSHDAVAHGRFA